MADPKIKLGLVSNVWAKQMVFENVGDFEQGHSHCFDHMTLLAAGTIAVTANGKTTEFVAPNMIFIKAGVEHALEARAPNTIVYCIHALRDGERIEDIVDPSMVPEGTTPANFLERFPGFLEPTTCVPEKYLDSRAV